jgi:hypothetical protein
VHRLPPWSSLLTPHETGVEAGQRRARPSCAVIELFQSGASLLKDELLARRLFQWTSIKQTRRRPAGDVREDTARTGEQAAQSRSMRELSPTEKTQVTSVVLDGPLPRSRPGRRAERLGVALAAAVV